jgi:hypothetical protein
MHGHFSAILTNMYLSRTASKVKPLIPSYKKCMCGFKKDMIEEYYLEYDAMLSNRNSLMFRRHTASIFMVKEYDMRQES